MNLLHEFFSHIKKACPNIIRPGHTYQLQVYVLTLSSNLVLCYSKTFASLEKSQHGKLGYTHSREVDGEYGGEREGEGKSFHFFKVQP
jgi:hypothetical protein